MAQQARAAATRENILESAAEVFSTTTYHLATLAELARAAGTTQGALYFHFESKRALAQEIVRRQHRVSIAAGEMFLSSDLPGFEAVIRLSGVLAGQIHSSPVVRAGLRLSTESAAELGSGVREPYGDWVATAEVLLARAAATGDLSNRLSVPLAARIVVGSFTGTQMGSGIRASWTDLRTRLEDLWTFLLPVLAAEERIHRFSATPRLVWAVDDELARISPP